MKKSMKRTLKILTLMGLLTGLLLGVSAAASAAGNTIKEAKAKKIALNKAGVKNADVKRWTKVRLDNWDDDGDLEWDIEFRTKTWRYEVEVNAYTGTVEDFEQKRIKSVKAAAIKEAQAKSIALEHAGVAASDVTKWTKVILDKNEWEFKFQTADRKFEVDVDANTGAVNDFEVKDIKPAATVKITEDEAKSIALERAGVTASDVTKWTKMKLDKNEWEFKFQTADRIFEVDVDVNTGKVKDFKEKKVSSSSSKKISEEEAKSIVLEHARKEASFSGDPVFTKIKPDWEHGMDVYEIEFRCGMWEFDYEINANTGAIIEWDIDYDD